MGYYLNVWISKIKAHGRVIPFQWLIVESRRNEPFILLFLQR